VEAVINEISVQKKFFKNIGSSVTTIYIGGGTPSVLTPEQVGRIVAALRDTFDLVMPEEKLAAAEELSAEKSFIEEFTIEVNPNDITPEYASFLVDLGVNRVSMGMQSFVDSHLKWMNRRHTSQEGIQAYRILRNAGINNISLDLIFGYSLLSDKEWEYNIDTMISLAPEHISAYQMSIEPGSCLSAMSRKGLYTPPTDEECLKQYTMLQTKLTAAGYNQYEISNFARQKMNTQATLAAECCISVHNSSYWDGTPYLGLGPAAHSFNGKYAPDGPKRLWNTPSVKKYCSHYCS
jgi:oxygen-independent coproporphyrinogen-3 oxidase